MLQNQKLQGFGNSTSCTFLQLVFDSMIAHTKINYIIDKLNDSFKKESPHKNFILSMIQTIHNPLELTS